MTTDPYARYKREWAVRDLDTGDVTTGFFSLADARDWADPNFGNPNPGNWEIVTRLVEDWHRPSVEPPQPSEVTDDAPPTWAPVNERALWVLSKPQITQYFKDKKINAIKINAIKEARGLSYWGLKEAKDAVEHAMWLLEQTRLSPEDYLLRYGPKPAEVIAQEEQEAIQSILGTTKHNHVTRDIKQDGSCPACAHYLNQETP